jgi:sugar (pentulose or hexulose) kinase
MNRKPVILILDIGKTNKKVLLFDQFYELVFEKSDQFDEVLDEDGFPTEDLSKLTEWVRTSVDELIEHKSYDVKAIHFSGYGASLVYLDSSGNPIFPLYNYLKPYPEALLDSFVEQHGSQETLSIETSSPWLGNLNSGLQLFRIKQQYPEKFQHIKYALHLPEYLSYVLTGKSFSNMTSIGCHTMLWNFSKNDYHKWVRSEKLDLLLAPIKNGDEIAGYYNKNIQVGVGLHDSSAALIPYLTSFNDPFILISTGTWCISMNPFNDQVITEEELKQDVLCYMTYQGKTVKASRLFAGNEHEVQVKRLAAFFGKPIDHYKSIKFDLKYVSSELGINQKDLAGDMEFTFSKIDLSIFSDYESAYYALMRSIISLQEKSTNLVLKNSPVKKIFVDGGFGKNDIFMGMLKSHYPELEVYSSVVAQASALGAAMALHRSWNSNALPTKLIELKRH